MAMALPRKKIQVTLHVACNYTAFRCFVVNFCNAGSRFDLRAFPWWVPMLPSGRGGRLLIELKLQQVEKRRCSYWGTDD